MFLAIRVLFKVYSTAIANKNDEIKTKSQLTATATKPHRDRKIRQFNNDQHSIDLDTYIEFI